MKRIRDVEFGSGKLGRVGQLDPHVQVGEEVGWGREISRNIFK